MYLHRTSTATPPHISHMYHTHSHLHTSQLSPENTPMWEPNPDPFTVEVRDPEKKKKFRGMKTFTAYHVVPSVRVTPHHTLTHHT